MTSLATSMATSLPTLKRSYILPNRLRDAALTQFAIEELLSNIPASEAAKSTPSALDVAKLNFSARVRKEAKPIRPSENGKRVRLLWSTEEEAALLKGVEVFGASSWSRILMDETVGPILSARSNIDLKDKWRCLSRQKRKLVQSSSDSNVEPIPSPASPKASEALNGESQPQTSS